MNQFGIASSDAAKVADILVAAQTYGTATVSQLAETFANFGVVAKDSNLTLIQGAALTEVLGSKMIVGAEAGTKLTSTLINLKNAGVGYASGQFNVSDALMEVREQVDGLGTAYEKDQRKIEIFGKRNITVGTILLDNIGKYEELTKQLDVNGIALDKQKTQTDNLAGSMGKFSSAWEVMILQLSGSGGTLQKTVDYFTRFIDGISLMSKYGIINPVKGLADAQQKELEKSTAIYQEQIKIGEIYDQSIINGNIAKGTSYLDFLKQRVDGYKNMDGLIGKG